MRFRVCALAPLLCGLMATSVAADREPGDIRHRLEALAAPGAGGDAPLFDVHAVRRFYAARDFQAAWFGPQCAKRFGELVLAIRESRTHGLDPKDYHHDELDGAAGCDAGTEILATDAWLSLAAHLHAGRVDPLSVEPGWTLARPTIEFAARLEEALAQDEVRAPLLDLAPDNPFYRALQEALARYLERPEEPGWIPVASGRDFRAGNEGPRVVQLRERLGAEGYLDAGPAGSPALFDEGLKAAVKAFQQRANLEPDGIVGPLTLNQLNLGPADHIAQLRANLERWRWLPDDAGDRHIEINIADFRLEAHAGGRIERVHKAIVGLTHRQTPMFTGAISYGVFNPWWETPRRLAVLDKLPQFRKDPGAVQRLGYQVLDQEGKEVDPSGIDWNQVPAKGFPYRIRQRPGPQNALGRIKLMFPNEYTVYLHDTPAQELFAKTRRAFSSGCIRVDNALDLAEWVLAGTPGWDRARIDEVVASGEVTTVTLAATVPVHIVYLTAVPDAEGGVRFVDDVYGRDAAVVAALDAPPAARTAR